MTAAPELSPPSRAEAGDPGQLRRRPRAASSIVVVAAPTALAALLALVRIGDLPLWRDEIATVISCGRSVGETLAILWNREANMSLYYLFMNGWLRLGHGEVWARLPSATFGAAAVAVTVVFTRRAFDRRTAVIAGTLLATNTLLIWYADQARSYALVALLAALSALLLLLAVERGGALRWASFVAAATAMVYCEILAALIVLAQLGSLVVVRPTVLRSWRPVAYASAVWALLAGPALAYALLGGRGQVDWLRPPGWSALVYTAEAFFNAPALAVALGALIVVAAVQTVHLARRAPRSPEAWMRTLVLAWALVLPILTYAVSQVKPLFLDRYLIGALPALMIAAALGIGALRIRALVVAVAAGVALFGAVTLLTEARPDWLNAPTHGAEREDLRVAASFLKRRQQPGDAIAYRSAEERLGLAYYYPRVARDVAPAPDIGLAPASPRERAQDIYPRDAAESLALARGRRHPRLWLIGQWEFPTCCPGRARNARALLTEFKPRARFTVGGVYVVLLERAPAAAGDRADRRRG